MNTYKRSYFVGKIPSIAEHFENAVDEINDIPTDDNKNNLTGLTDLPKGEIKKGVFLANSVQDWESANEFLRKNIHHNANIEDVNSEIRDMQNTIYDYFSETHGSVKDGEKNPFDTNYREILKNECKRQLKTLKKLKER